MMQQFLNTAASGAFGALAFHLFTNIDPSRGAAFGVITYMVNKVAQLILSKVLKSDSATLKFGGFLSRVGSVALAATECTSAGFPMSLVTGLAIQTAQVGLQ